MVLVRSFDYCRVCRYVLCSEEITDRYTIARLAYRKNIAIYNGIEASTGMRKFDRKLGKFVLRFGF